VGFDRRRAGLRGDVEKAVFYPEDDRFLVDRELTVAHYEIATGTDLFREA